MTERPLRNLKRDSVRGRSPILLALVLFGAPAAAQDAERVAEILNEDAAADSRTAGDEDAAARNAADESEAEDPPPLFYFRDRSKVAGRLVLATIDIETSYGLLRVPTSHLVRVRFARRLSPELEETIARRIEELGDDDLATRQKAAERLEEIGVSALTALRDAVKSPRDEVRKKAEELLAAIYSDEEEETPGEEDDGLPPLQGTDDEVIASRMTIRGRITRERFLIRSRYGTLQADTGMLAGIVFRVTGPSSRKVGVAATFQPPGNWFDTRLELERGQRFRIAASGIISVSNYSVSAGPDGSTQYASNRSFQGFPVLSLVGKIGKSGRAFLIGSAYKGKAAGSGKLYLGITPFYYNPAGAGGTYQVKVDVAGGR